MYSAPHLAMLRHMATQKPARSYPPGWLAPDRGIWIDGGPEGAWIVHYGPDWQSAPNRAAAARAAEIKAMDAWSDAIAEAAMQMARAEEMERLADHFARITDTENED